MECNVEFPFKGGTVSKTYTILCKGAKKLFSKGFGVSSEFTDQRRVMVISGIGNPRLEGKDIVIDIQAIEKLTESKPRALMRNGSKDSIQPKAPHSSHVPDKTVAASDRRKRNMPWIMVRGGDKAMEYLQRLATVLNGKVAVVPYEKFRKNFGYSSDSLEQWLKEAWTLQDINRVYRMEEDTGQYPFVLIEKTGTTLFRLRLYCPKPEHFPDIAREIEGNAR
jgi:hypothetical protein